MIVLTSVTDNNAVLREAFGCFPSGVAAVCALDGSEPVGIAASSFTSVSMTPALVSVCVQNSSTTWPRLRALPRLGISVLAQGQDEACLSLSSKVGDRFGALSWSANDTGAVLIQEAVAWLDSSIYAEFAAGDHRIVVLEIHALATEPDRPPLVFHGSKFRQLEAVATPSLPLIQSV
ncbi:flavin reductase [Rhodococcus sp. RS1C4]|nr:flavin reductase family protein [Rhodococcus sp. RS1C4]OZC42673.1 flavin reductase [Rhodococcus sp. RS1C4]